MLGTLQAMLPGAASARPVAPPISLWSFDETGGPSFADLGPAHVPMTIVGTWASLTTDSLVEGVGGTSAYTNGSASYATIPANQPQHDLAALTISFYYQRHSAVAKHILLAAGDGTQAGDFSIEVLPNGRLRGYHVGQDAELRFFGSSEGIAGTDLQVGTAHRIDVTLGSLGARIYLDGELLISAVILANTNGWNNSRAKYLGVFTDGVGAPADGAFDRLRLWNRQLTGAQIATLEPPQSITLPTASQAPVIPSFVEWLVNDDMPIPASGTVRYAKPNGSGVGGTSEATAGAIQATVSAMSPGDTTVLIPTSGTEAFFSLTGGLQFPSGGSNASRYTIMAKPGTAAIIDAGQEFAVFRTPNTGRWVHHSGNVWRSVTTTTAPSSPVRLWGVWHEFGIPHFMAHGYTSLSALSASSSSAGQPPSVYRTPGAVLHTDGKVYIRMEKPNVNIYSIPTTGYPSGPFASDGRHLPTADASSHASGKIQYPLSTDPNDYSIYLARWTGGTTGGTFTSAAGPGGGNVVIGSGVNSFGLGTLVRLHTNVTVRRGLHFNWYGVSVLTTDLNNVFFHRARMTVGCGAHMARDDFKFGGWLENWRHGAIHTSGNTYQNLYFLDCSFLGWHEILLGAGFSQVRFRNCFFWHTIDEGFQTPASVNKVEVGYCYFLHAAIGGNGAGGSGISGKSEWYIHHNLFDARTVMNYEDGLCPNGQHIWIGHSPANPQPRKQYNNVFLVAPDHIRQHTGVHACHNYGLFNINTTTADEFFNNIVVTQYDARYYNAKTSFENAYADQVVGRGSNFNAMFKGSNKGATVHYHPDDSNAYMDYNYYGRHVPYPPGESDFHCYLYNANRGTPNEATNFIGVDSKAAWTASAQFAASKGSGSKRGAYSPGFDANSTFEQAVYGTTSLALPIPSVQSFGAAGWTGYPNGDRWNYRPTSNLPGTASSLSGEDWWSTQPSWGDQHIEWSGLAPNAWKGALDPNGGTTPVGLQNP